MEIVVIFLVILLVVFLVVRAHTGAKRRHETVLSDGWRVVLDDPHLRAQKVLKKTSEKTISD
jgi:hypothetical protein